MNTELSNDISKRAHVVARALWVALGVAGLLLQVPGARADVPVTDAERSTQVNPFAYDGSNSITSNPVRTW